MHFGFMYLFEQKTDHRQIEMASFNNSHQTFTDFESSVQAFYSFMLQCSKIERILGVSWQSGKTLSLPVFIKAISRVRDIPASNSAWMRDVGASAIGQSGINEKLQSATDSGRKKARRSGLGNAGKRFYL